MLKRTDKNLVNQLLSKNLNWKILDIGCGYSANKNATVVADVINLENFYKERNFVKINEKKLPFKDKEFDYVISSHVIEHVQDFEFFLSELERISSKGYIELPTRLGDNLIFENKKEHLWWFSFDDINKQLNVSKKNQLIDPFLNVSTGKLFEEMFRESMVIELTWENKIEYKLINEFEKKNFSKISFIKLIKKYFSKKIRSIYK